jgi:hypothetical protein
MVFFDVHENVDAGLGCWRRARSVLVIGSDGRVVLASAWATRVTLDRVQVRLHLLVVEQCERCVLSDNSQRAVLFEINK